MNSVKIYLTLICLLAMFGFEARAALSLKQIPNTQPIVITSAPGNVSSQYNDAPSNEGIERLTDQNVNTKYLTFHSSVWVQFEAQESYVLTEYSIVSANDVPNRDPANWVLSGSNDGSNWESIDSRNNELFSNRFQRKTFIVQTSTDFKYFRLSMSNTSGNILQLAEMELVGTLANSGVEDITDLPGSVTAQYADAPNGEGIDKLIDNSTSTKYLTFHNAGWVQFQSQEPFFVSSYSIASANDAEERDPKSWSLKGSNDGANWSTMDVQDNINFINRLETQSFTIQTVAAYQYWRLEMHNNSGNILQLSEIELYGEKSTNGNLPVANFSSNTSQIQEGGVVTFVNNSANATSYNWSFPGGTPTTSTAFAPQVVYETEGTYDVTLTAVNTDGSHSDTKVGYIEVSNTATNCEWGNNFLTPNVIFTDYDGVTTGAQIFSQIIPNPESYMQQRCLDVAKILYRNSSEAPRFRELTFELKNEDFVAYKWGGGDAIGIAVSTQHLTRIYNQSGGNEQVIKDEIDGILFHEVTHGYNNSPTTGGEYDGQSPFWAYTEGIADAVRIHAGFHQTRQPDPNNSRKWLGGYTTTGFFLHYISQKFDKNFLYKFNERATSLGQAWSFDTALQSIIGQDASTTWNQYASYINGGSFLDYDGDYPWQLDCPAPNNTMALKANPKDIESQAFEIYPLPVRDAININSKNGSVQKDLSVVVLDQAGQEVLKKPYSNKIYIGALKRGFYIFTITQKDKVLFREKITKQ